MPLTVSNPNRIAVLGPAGTFSDGLARDIAHCPIDLKDTFGQVIDAVEADSGTAALLPVKSTMDRTLYENIGALQNRRLRVTNLHMLEVIPSIMGLGTLDEAKVIAGKDVALGQIRGYLPHLARKPMSSTSAAGKEIQRTGDRTMLAVGSRLQAQIYGLTILKANAQDPGVNETTFLEVRQRLNWSVDPATIDTSETIGMTAIIRTPENQHAGSLYRALGELADRDIDQDMIESLPIRGTRQSEFFVVCSGEGRAMADLITNHAPEHMSLDVLGVYPEPITYTT